MAMNGTFGKSAPAAVTICGYGAGTPGAVLTTKGTNGWWQQINACVIPANASGVGGYVDINYEWSSSITAGTTAPNYFFLTMAGLTLGAATSLSAVGSYRGNMRIRNVDGHQQIVTVVNGDGIVGGNLFNFSCDMTIDQTVTFWSNAGIAGTNCIALKGWSVEAHRVSATATPSGLVLGLMFYGINHHYTYGNTPPRTDVISAMHGLGFNTMRASWYGRSASSGGGIDNTTWVSDMASAFAATSPKINMMLMTAVSPYSSSAAPFASELAAYNFHFDQGSYAASVFGPKGVYLYEMGNEIDADSKIRRILATQGTAQDDFSLSTGSVWSQWRGAMRGMHDGIKSVQPNALVGSNAFVNASIWASDALWNGLAPDGTIGNPVVRWDWTNWHLYTENDATNVAYGPSEPSFNLLKYLHRAYNRPIVISEFNPSQSTASSKVIVTQWMSTWYQHQADYNIAGIVFYDWFDSPYQIANSDATPSVMNSVGAAIVNFISANPALK